MLITQWTKIGSLTERDNWWANFNPEKEDIRWISYITWVKVITAWYLGLGEASYLVCKDTDPTHVWKKYCVHYPQKWKVDDGIRFELDDLWQQANS